MVLVCLVAFFVPVAGDMQLDPLTQAKISSFTAIIGIVIPSYIDDDEATAYVQTRKAPTTTEASTQLEEVKREGDALEEAPGSPETVAEMPIDPEPLEAGEPPV